MAGINALVMPTMRLLPPEAAHRLALRALSLGLGPEDRLPDPAVLATTVWGRDFRNPIGLAAGFDKDARVPDAMLAAGFGFVEAGTVTPLPQSGNPKPRLFRLSRDQAVINRMGFNSGGLEPFLKRIRDRGRDTGPFGVNAGRNRDTTDAIGDYATVAKSVAPYADYIVLNISSPNTPGLRRLQQRNDLAELLAQVMEACRQSVVPGEDTPPIVVKISPDLGEAAREDVAEQILAAGVDGLTVANTTVTRPGHLTDPRQDEAGGLSGSPLFPIALAAVRDMYRLTGGRIPIIAAGGVSSGADAYAMIRAGASLVQIYTALVFHGLSLVPRLKHELAALLQRDGFSCVAEATGADVSLMNYEVGRLPLVA